MQKISKQETTFSWSPLVHDKSPLIELFITGIREAYWAENHLVRMLLKLANESSSADLHNMLDNDIERTRTHINKLEDIFELLDETIDAKKNNAMAGLALEAGEMIEYTDDGTSTRDMGIILVCKKIKQYEIATYSGLMKLSTTMGREDIADMFASILNDENDINELLNNQCEVISLIAGEELG